MGNVITNLKARFGVDTSDFKKGLKDGEKATDDFKGAAGGALDEFASMFGVNMSAVNDALGTAHKSLNFLSQSFTGAAKGGNILAIALKFLKVALISTGLGAIVVVLGSVIAYFQKSGEGSDKFAKILMQLKSVLNNIVERLVAFGEGIVDIFSGRFKEGAEKMRTAFKGIGQEIKEDWQQSGKLADAMDALEDREIDLITSLEERRAKIAELRLQAKEEQEDQKKRLALLKEAEALTRGVYGDQVSIEKERLRIMKEKLAISSKDPTDEQRREVAEQEAKISSLLREQAQDLKAIVREKKTALDVVTAELELEKKKAETIGIVRAELNNLQMPDFNQIISDALAPVAKIQEAIKGISIDLSGAINDALNSLAVGIGEFLGNLMIGDSGFKNFGQMVAGVFAEMAITVGKIAIATGIAALAIKNSLKLGNPAVAIAAGIALVALGTAVKGSLASVASGSSGTSGSSLGGSGYSYDTRNISPAKTSTVNHVVTMVAKGTDLVGVIETETNRRSTNT